MFLGEMSHQLDAKNRLRIPSCFKNELGSSYVFCLGANKNTIYVYPRSVIEEKIKAIHDRINEYDANEADIFSEYLSGIYLVEEDAQGRVLVCEELRTKVDLGKDVITVGAYDHLEIVSKAYKAERKKKINYADIMSFIANKMKNENGI